MTAKRTTDDLINDLAARPVPVPLSARSTLFTVLAALLPPLALFWLAFGLRPDLGAALLQVNVLAKTILPFGLALLAASLAFGSGRPGRQVRLWPLALPALAGLLLVGLRLAEGPDALLAEMLGQTAVVCMASITVMSAIPLWVALRFFQHAAPTQPVLTGGLLGLAVGAGVTSGYALHCTEDSPLFFMAWYVLAICTVTGIGAALGHRLLRW